MRIFEITPAPCLCCGRGNAQATAIEDRPRFVDLERDVNWNDPAILCEDCIMKLGGLIGMLSGDERNSLRATIRNLKEENHELEAEIDGMQRRAKRLGITFDKAVA